MNIVDLLGRIGLIFFLFLRFLSLGLIEMTGAIRSCFLCVESKHSARSKHITIGLPEQQRRLRNAYVKRHKIEITGSLIGKEMRRKCFRSNKPLITFE